MKPQLSTLSRVVILIAFYFVGGLLGNESSFMSGTVSVVWPPAGIALAAVLLFGYRFWPGVAIGGILFSFVNGNPLGFFTFGTAVGNTVGALVCAFLLERFINFKNGLERVRDVAGFVGFACLLGTTVNAAFNVVGLVYAGQLPWEQMFPKILEWWVPNAMAGLVVAPVILTWGSPSFVQWNSKRVVEGLVCGICLICGTLLSNSWYVYGIGNYPLAYLPYPFLVWGALRFGQRGATTGTLIVSGLAIYALLQGRGPFVVDAQHQKESLMLLGSYIAVVAITNLLLAAAASERRVAEDNARKSEAMFLLISENVGDLIAVTDSAGKRLYNSPYYTKVLAAPQQLQGTNAFEQIHAEDREKVKKAFQETIQTGIGQRLEYRFVLADGSIRYIESLGNFVRGNRGELDKVVSISRDITERKRDEESLRLLASAVRFADDSIVITTADLDDPGPTIVFVNPGFTRMTGYTAEEAIGKTPRILHGPKTDRDVLNRLRYNLTHGQIFFGETINYRKDGSPFFNEYHIEPIKNDKGETTHYLAIQRDISERKQIEVDLAKARDAALAAARLKAEFLANMSHEIRTPMNGVIGMTNLLLNTELTKTQRDFAETIGASADALLTIINDILDFSKIEAGKLTFENVDFDLREAIHGTLELLAEKAHAKGVELAGYVPPEVPGLLRGDPGRLRQVITNLVGNAIKFTHHGEVVVKLSKESETETAATLRFEIKDTGIGIPQEAQALLFRAFSQADGSTTRKYGGTGLGLAISKQLVELMQGQVGLESKPGKGSTFWFTVTLGKQPVAQKAAVKERIALKDVRVLVVDDNATNREILCEQTRSWGMRPTTAANGNEALALLRGEAQGNPFRVVLIDMQMPSMDGQALTKAIRADKNLAATKIIMLTSLKAPLNAEALKEIGANESILKPVRQSTLFECLCRIMDANYSNSAPEKPAARRAPAAERARQPLRILLAEDNLINQKVALGQLDELGYTADVAANGLEVLDSLQRSSYEVILMDCQMPEMDGYESTEIIRQREHDLSHSSTPKAPLYIIAMTANAMQGDREKCLSTGMNDYISKPVEVEELRAALERFKSKVKPVPVEIAPVDMKRLGRITGNDPKKMKDLIDLYLSQAEDLIKNLESAIQEKSPKDVEFIAHKFCGSSASCGMNAVVPSLRELERRGRDGVLLDAENLYQEANTGLHRIKEFFSKSEFQLSQLS